MEVNAIYCGDCLDVLKRFPDGKIDLIYLDPPFFSNKHYEIIWKDGAEIRAFGDRWKGGIMHYVNWMRDRIEQCHRVLKDTGSIYVHCDWHAVYYLKVMMDKVFGQNNFRNDIIWHYGQRTMHNRKKWNSKHDNILFYAKSSKTVIKNIVTEPWTEEEIAKTRARKIQIDKDGRKFIWDNRSVSKGYPPRKQYIDDIVKKGKAIDDVWDIPMILSTSKERLGYPTQKPVALLERIIKASSNLNDIILDPFCGCGTTLVASQKLSRRWIGIDVSRTACKLMSKRIRSTGITPHLIWGELTEKELKKYPPFEFQNWVCEKLGGRISQRKSGDMGVDGWTLDMTPIQVKQSPKIGRVEIDKFAWAIKRANKKKGIFVALSFGKGAYEEVARAKDDDIEIKLLTVKELLEGKGALNG